MIKNKIIAFVTCGVLVTAGITSGALILNKNINQKTVQNHVLLAAPNLDKLAVVINTNVSPLVLYKSPSFNSNIESYISVGEMLNYEATSNPDFYKVTVQETGASGYISANDLQIIESGLNKAYENVNKNEQVINVTTDVKLMSSPDVYSQILGSYKNSTKMNVLGKQNQWYKVNINGQIGYMYQEYVGIDNLNTTTSTRISYTNSHTNNLGNGRNIFSNSNLKGKTVYTNPNLITFIQKLPTSSSQDIQVIKNKSLPFKVLKVVNDSSNNSVWYEVENSNGDKGYISQDETYKNIISTSTKKNIPIFKLPDTSSQIIMSTKNQKVNFYVIANIEGESNAMDTPTTHFYKVRTVNGDIGYMQYS